jgi:RNA polymerase sigma-70 factor (ECF subfamily)
LEGATLDARGRTLRRGHIYYNRVRASMTTRDPLQSHAPREPMPNARQTNTPDWSQLFSEVKGELLSVARRIVGSSADADDVVQTAWLRAAAAPMMLSGEHLRGWLLIVVKRAAIDSHRRALARRASPLHPEQLPAPIVTQVVLHREAQLLALQDAIGKLPPILRTTVELRVHHGLSYAQIATGMNVPTRTVATRLHRAKSHLAAALKSLPDSAEYPRPVLRKKNAK